LGNSIASLKSGRALQCTQFWRYEEKAFEVSVNLATIDQNKTDFTGCYNAIAKSNVNVGGDV